MRTRLRSTTLLVLIMSSLAIGIAAVADGGCDNPLAHKVCAAAHDGNLRVGLRERIRSEPKTTKVGLSPQSGTTDTDTWNRMGAAFCADAGAEAATAGGPPPIEALCGLLPVAGAVAAVPGRAEVLAAFRELGLYRGAVRSDPGRASFVNLETYFWCGDGAQTCNVLGEGERTVTLLGQAVRIRPRIVSYEWRFGDGSSERVTAGRVAHTYGHTGAMAVSVTLTWTADYAVGGDGFRPIGGTTTTTSPVRLLPVQEAQTINDL
jgi:PKD domain-containing protein